KFNAPANSDPAHPCRPNTINVTAGITDLISWRGSSVAKPLPVQSLVNPIDQTKPVRNSSIPTINPYSTWANRLILPNHLDAGAMPATTELHCVSNANCSI